MKKIAIIAFLVLLIPLIIITVQPAIANPMVGLGYIFDVDPLPAPYDTIVQGTQDATGKWIVNPGVTYLVTLREVEYNYARISIHGSYTNGSKWEIVRGTNIPDDGADPSGNGWIYYFDFTVPDGAGCTITIHYKQGTSDTSGNPNSETHVAAQAAASSWIPGSSVPDQIGGKLKNYYVGGGAIPCEATGVPEFPFVSAVAISLGLVGMLLIRRRQKKSK